MPERNDKPLEAAVGLAFPTVFPIKIMGRRETGFTQAVIEIVSRHAPDFMPGSIEARPSREGKYVSLTATVNATSQEQLDALYQDAAEHVRPHVVLRHADTGCPGRTGQSIPVGCIGRDRGEEINACETVERFGQCQALGLGGSPMPSMNAAPVTAATSAGSSGK